MTQDTEHDESPSEQELPLDPEPQVSEPSHDGAAEVELGSESAADAPVETEHDDLEAAIAEANANLAEEEPAAAEASEAEEPAASEQAVDSEEPASNEGPAAEEEPADKGEAAADGESESAEPEAPDVEPEVVSAALSNDSVSNWPFVIYDIVWLLFAGTLVWQFQQLPAGQAVFDSSLYATAVAAGVALTIAGPLLILATWIGSWGRDGASKGALFISALAKGSIATLLGVTLWWVALMVLDQLRLGRFL